MAETKTLEELLAEGATPEPPPDAQTLTLEQLQAMGATPPPQVSAAETFVERAAQALPTGELVPNLLSAALMQVARRSGLVHRGTPAELTPQARAELEAMGEQTPSLQVPQPVEEYRALRGERRMRTAAGSEQNPRAAIGGTAAGIAASILAPGPKAAPGATLTQRLGSAARTGAGAGALSGVTSGTADLTEGDWLGAARDVATGAGLGGTLGLGGGAMTEALRPLAGALLRFARRRAADVLQGGSDIAVATRKSLQPEAAEEAIRSGAIRPLGTTQGAYERLSKMAEQQGTTLGRIIDELEAAGVKGPDARKLADELLERGAAIEPNTFIEGVPARFLERAEQVAGKARDGRLGLRQAEELKRSSQKMARFERLTASPLEEAEQEISSRLRQSVEDVIDEAAKSPGSSADVRALAERFKPVKDRLARVLEARRFAEMGAAKAAQRQPLGIKDVMIGTTMGDPVSALGTAMVSKLARSRIPSALATDSYALSQALSSGAAASAGGRAGAAEDALRAYLAEELRKRQRQETK